MFAENQLREVEREAVGIVEGEGIDAAQGLASGSVQLFHLLIQKADTRLQRAEESVFFFLDNLFNQDLLGNQFGISIAHLLDQHRQELIHERLFLSEERISVTHGTAQDAADDVARLGIRRQLPVGDGESHGTQVVGHDAHRYVHILLLAVFLAGQAGDFLDDRLENIGIIVGMFPLQGAYQTFEAHACIDDVHRELLQRAVCLAVELHEDEVPDFDDLRIVLID